MQASSVDVAIVTVTYNCADFIEEFLEAVSDTLRRQDPASVLVVVDNQSTDATVDKARDYIERNQLQDQIFLRPQQENWGFGTGCNIGAEAAEHLKPRYFWFLNPDTRVFPDTGKELKRFFETEPTADFVGSQLVNGDGEARPSAFRFPSYVSEFCRAIRLGLLDRVCQRGQLAMPVTDQPHPADWLTGASFMVKRDVFDALEGFDTRFFLYFEEVDLFYRARQEGYNCWINPNSKVYHFAGASTGISSSRKATKPRPQYWFDSRRYFYCKNFGRSYFALCDMAAITGLSLWKLRTLLEKKDSGDPPGLLKAIAANSLFGYREQR
jgi:N-acetylglucosaminyl-diphospho-decaprenol L-rhamnosyltransferase